MNVATMAERRHAPSAPQRVMQISWGLAGAATLVAALDLGVFTRLNSGPASAAAMAKALHLSVRGTEALLLGLAALRLVRRLPDARYELEGEAREYLVEGEPSYLGGLRHVFHSLNARIWPHLATSVREGRPCRDLFGGGHVGNWDAVVPYLNVLGRPAAVVLARELGRRLTSPFRVLDAGCGSGLYGQTVALLHQRASVVAIDRADVLSLARAQAAIVGVADRITDVVGDLRDIPFGSQFDAVILSHVLHGYGRKDALALVRKATRALRPGGLLVINEFLPDVEDPAATPMQALFSLQMLLTSEGAAYGIEDYQGWASEVGLSPFITIAPPGPMTLLFGERPAA
jgi:SAM-dependent methyltransferase